MSFSGYIGKFGGEVNSLAPLTGPLAYLLAIAAAKWAYDDTQQSLVVMSHGNSASPFSYERAVAHSLPQKGDRALPAARTGVVRNRRRDRRRLSEGPQIKIRTIPRLHVNGLWGV